MVWGGLCRGTGIALIAPKLIGLNSTELSVVNDKMDRALRCHAVREIDVYIEQPCLSYRECLAVRQHTGRPFILDEVVDLIDMLVQGVADRAMDVINLKISKVGGLTKARQIRDLAVSLGIALTIEDTWGGDITTAAIAHLAP